MKKKISRRQFAKNLSSLGLSAAALNTLGVSGLLSSSAAMAQSSDYKALVYILLEGGNDSFNMVVPQESGSLRTRYEDGRRAMALPANSLHSLDLRSDALISSGETYNGFGMHASCGDLANMFNDGELGILANVGNLVQPTDRSNMNDPSHRLPPQLFSHADQQRQVVSQPGSFVYGWGGRVAELVANSNTNQSVSPLITTAGVNTFQTSRDRFIKPYVTGTNGPPSFLNFGNAVRREMVEDFMTGPSFDIFSERNREVYDSGVKAAGVVRQAFNLADNSSINYNQIFSNANTSIGNQLEAIAKLIYGRQATAGNNRPIFYVRMGGWDAHRNLLNSHRDRLRELNNALRAFRNALVAQGDFDNTLTHIGSEFGRTFTPNNSGTDHGWGGHMMVMGGAVNGGHMFGRYPDLQLGGERDSDSRGRGRWIPQTSTQQTAAIISNWMGVPQSNLVGIFPTLANFENSFGANANLNFVQGV